MQMTFIKTVLEVGSGSNSIQTTEGFNFKGEFDIDNLWGTLTFNLPYLLPGQKSVSQAGTLDLTRLKKYDTANLFFGEFERNLDSVTTTTNGMSKVFHGYVDSIRLVKNKDGFDYEISALGTMALAGERNLAFNRKSGEFKNLLAGGPIQVVGQTGEILNQDDIGLLQLTFGSELNRIIPEVEFVDIDTDTLFVNVDGGENLKEVLSQIRDNYAIIIHQNPNGTLTSFTPFFLLQARSNVQSFGISNAWTFELAVNIFNLDYGDLSSNINSVVVLGYPPAFGMAVDPIAVQLNAGSGNAVTQSNYNYEIRENRNLTSDLDCEKTARNILLDKQRNYSVTFKTKFDPRYRVGQPVVINDNDRFNAGQLWIIKKFAYNISKEDVSCDITVFTNSLTVFPENIVIEPTGIADIGALELRDKLTEQIANTGGFQ